MSDQPDPATCAETVLQKLADMAERELPAGYTLELKLARLGETFGGTEIYVIAASSSDE